VAQSTKKPRKTHISDEDWNRYVEALRREGVRRREEEHPEKHSEAKGARP
jgi:hypothetical protein